MNPVIKSALYLITALLVLTGCSEERTPPSVNILEALSQGTEPDCFKRADPATELRFPDDFGAHDNYRTEWWYYTGNLFAESGRHFGYQLTFFRQALSCGEPLDTNGWQTRQIFFAHFALTDTQSNKFHSFDRMNRESLMIAGAQAVPFRVWIDDWETRENANSVSLSARQDGVHLALKLTASKPILLQGRNGFSPKGQDPSNASHYYSIPRWATDGRIRIDGESFMVKGTSWFDHEWSTSALSDDVVGWDWFAIHLDDGTDIMVCQVRQKDGTANGYSFGAISDPDASQNILGNDDFKIRATRFWTSPVTGKTYPSQWVIDIPTSDMRLEVVPVINAQEHHHRFTYWEGAVTVTGHQNPGMGYMELTGY